MKSILKGKMKDGLTSSFTVVTIVVCTPMLYFSLQERMDTFSKVMLGILGICFLYWAIWFWDKLQLHLAHMKDRKWLRAQEDKKALMEILKPKKKKRRNKRRVLKRKRTVNRRSWFRFSWFRRDWELIDKTILPSGWDQFKESGARIKGHSMAKFFSQTVILTFKCRITGKVKTKVVRG